MRTSMRGCERTPGREGALRAEFGIAFLVDKFRSLDRHGRIGLAIYTFFLTTESGFIGKAKRSIYYRQLLTYVLIATVLSAITALISVPGMVVKEAPEPHSIHAIYVGIWSGLSVWTAAARAPLQHFCTRAPLDFSSAPPSNTNAAIHARKRERASRQLVCDRRFCFP